MKTRPLLLKGAGAIAGVATTVPVLADTRQTGDWGHHGMMWNGGTHWIMGSIMMLLFLIITVALVVLVIRWIGGTPQSSQPSSSSARQTLEERFARGEIDEEEFRKRKRALEE